MRVERSVESTSAVVVVTFVVVVKLLVVVGWHFSARYYTSVDPKYLMRGFNDEIITLG